MGRRRPGAGAQGAEMVRVHQLDQIRRAERVPRLRGHVPSLVERRDHPHDGNGGRQRVCCCFDEAAITRALF